MKPLILLEQGLNENSGVCYVLCVSNETCVCVCVQASATRVKTSEVITSWKLVLFSIANGNFSKQQGILKVTSNGSSYWEAGPKDYLGVFGLTLSLVCTGHVFSPE